ncbi:MAG TPA: AIR synthase-related protein [Terriglobia bacterium]|nr:AIR synthase-related protein [Terriglobia bacterium]
MAIHSIYTLSQDDPEARTWLSFFRRRGHSRLTNVRIERVVWLEGDINLERLMPLLVNPLYQMPAESSQLDPSLGPIVEIAYRPAVTDPETPSILAGARALGESGLQFARLSRRYQFCGLEDAEAKSLAARFLYNKVVERIREPHEAVTTLRPSGKPDPVSKVSFQGLGDNELAALSRERSWYAPLSQMKVIQAHERERGHPYTDAEVEILVQSWSDHCYHTTWKSLGLLKKLMAATRKINHPLVVSSFTDNAGGMDFADGWVVTIKGETHNFPSSIAPFGGIATKHGGVIRDTLGFGKGAYPIGGTTVMGTMDPRLPEQDVPPGALHPGLIVSESIRATAYYVNPMGIPMMHPVYRCHPGYAKCFALGHSLGLIPRKYARKDQPRPGDVAVLFGGATGRDGIHGATASSAAMTGETLEKESAAVQIGHPITERSFTTAIPLLRDRNCLRTITDLGAGGISCAVGEMGADTGVWITLDNVPLKDQSLTAWEILLSESQERMLMAVPVEKIQEAESILDRFEVAHTTLGYFTDSGRLQVQWKGDLVVDLGMDFLWRACPIDPTPTSAPQRRLAPLKISEPHASDEWSRAIHGVLRHYHCADQSPAGTRFDSTVQGRTAVGPYAGKNHRMPTNIYVSAPLRDKQNGIITTLAFNPFYGEVDPAALARLMMFEAITKAVVAGSNYREMVLCDNFYTPRVRPETAFELVQMVDTIAGLSIELGVPFISGKDSSSGTFEAGGRRIDVPPTLAVATMGRVSDVKATVTKDFKRAGNRLLLLGRSDANLLGGTVYADSQGQRGDRLFDVYDAISIRVLWDYLVELHSHRKYVSGSAIAEGGILLRLFEAAFGSGLGASLDFGSIKAARRDGFLFGEFIGSCLLEVEPDFKLPAHAAGIPHQFIGLVTAEPRLRLADGGKVIWEEEVEQLAKTWTETFREVVK